MQAEDRAYATGPCQQYRLHFRKAQDAASLRGQVSGEGIASWLTGATELTRVPSQFLGGTPSQMSHDF